MVTTVRAAEKLAKAADRFLTRWRLTLSQFNLLAILMDRREGLAQHEIGDRLVVSRANVTGLVGRMKRRGLCRTSAVPGDSRVKHVEITPAGVALMGKIEKIYFREIDRLTKAIAAADLTALAETLDRLQQSM